MLGASCFLGPIENPDLWWHLSAGRHIWETGAVPRADFLSHTRLGAPWLDFEWLIQLLYYGVHSLAGSAGLVGLRVLALGGVLAGLWRLLGLLGAGAAARGLACAWAGIALFPIADLRPDNVSLLFFIWLWAALEKARQGRGGFSPRSLALAAAFFALWANIHLGFAYGLALVAAYAAPAPRRWLPLLIAAAAGTALNPYGPSLYGVLARHAAELGGLADIICEWKPPNATDPRQWPYLLLLAGSLSALLADRLKGKRAPLPLVLACACFGLASASHLRHLSYAVLAALPALACVLPGLLSGRPAWARRGAAAAGLAALIHASFIIWPLLPPFSGGPWRPEPAGGVADFLQAEAAVLGGKRLYNSWGDGGYLGWRLHPRYPVFQDGRYIFHGLLEEGVAAAKSAGGWRQLMERRAVQIACLKRSTKGSTMETVRASGGRRVALRKPYWRSYMPERDWALVWWNERDMIFVRRAQAPASWLAQFEYKSLLPDHQPLAEERAALGLEPRARLLRETERQLRQRAP